MADPGSVSYLFNRKGVIIVPKSGTTEDDLIWPKLLDRAGLVGRGAVVGYTQHRSGDAVSPCDVPCRLSDRSRPHLP